MSDSSAGIRAALGVSATLLLVPAVAPGTSSGPEPGMTGVPAGGSFAAETTCQSCHVPPPAVPPSGGTLEIIGLPDRYLPGKRYAIQLRLRHSQDDRLRWGFQLTAVDLTRYQRAGHLEVTDPVTTQHVGGGFGGREYVEHTHQGTGIGRRGEMSWTFDWVAPKEAIGEIGFFAAANAANADGAKEGDWIVTQSPAPLAIMAPMAADDPE